MHTYTLMWKLYIHKFILNMYICIHIYLYTYICMYLIFFNMQIRWCLVVLMMIVCLLISLDYMILLTWPTARAQALTIKSSTCKGLHINIYIYIYICTDSYLIYIPMYTYILVYIYMYISLLLTSPKPHLMNSQGWGFNNKIKDIYIHVYIHT
jgi:hypothetical protein